jgi:DNA-directed RNA polymerase specialized sigma24 family protein
MKTYHIQSRDGINTEVSREEYLNASKSRNEQGRKNYYAFRDQKDVNRRYYPGDNYLLIPIDGLPEAVAACKQFHSDEENDRNKRNRRQKHRLEGQPECIRDCDKCKLRSLCHTPTHMRYPISLDRFIEETGNDIESLLFNPEESYIYERLLEALYQALELLNDCESRVLSANFGLYRPQISMREFAESESIPETTATSWKRSALKKLRNILKDWND